MIEDDIYIAFSLFLLLDKTLIDWMFCSNCAEQLLWNMQTNKRNIRIGFDIIAHSKHID